MSSSESRLKDFPLGKETIEFDIKYFTQKVSYKSEFAPPFEKLHLTLSEFRLSLPQISRQNFSELVFAEKFGLVVSCWLELEVDEGLHAAALELDDEQHDEGEEERLTDERHATDAALEGTEGTLRDEVRYEA